MQRIYMDYASTTPLKTEVLDAMTKSFKTQHLLNHEELFSLKKQAEEMFFKSIGTKKGHIVYTTNGTHANNIVIQSSLSGLKKHIISSSIEHSSIDQMLNRLSKEGVPITKVPCDRNGIVNVRQIEESITPETALISIMMANNEIGSIQPIKEISEIAKKHNVHFHVDAIQGLGKIPINLDDQYVDAMTFSAHKIFGPKGIGAIYVGPNFSLDEDLLSSTENIPYIVGFSKALELMEQDKNAVAIMQDLKMIFVEKMLELPFGISVVSDPIRTHPGIVSFYFENHEADELMIQYDLHGIGVSSGSACSSGAISASHVLLALGFSEKEAKRCLRFSLSTLTTLSEVDRVIEVTKIIL